MQIEAADGVLPTEQRFGVEGVDAGVTNRLGQHRPPVGDLLAGHGDDPVGAHRLQARAVALPVLASSTIITRRLVLAAVNGGPENWAVTPVQSTSSTSRTASRVARYIRSMPAGPCCTHPRWG